MSDENEGIFCELYNKLFAKSWPMWVGAIILSILSTALYIALKPWGQSGGLNYMGNVIFNFVDTAFLDHPYSILAITTFLGAFGSALLAREYNVRIPPYGELLKGLIGGLIMGVGCILGQSCTIGGFYSGFAQLSGGALVFTLGLLIGTYIAVRYLLWEVEKYPGVSTGKSITYTLKSESKVIQPIVGVLIILVGFLIAAFAWQDDYIFGETIFVVYATIGVLIGFVLQRSRFCIVRALREPFMTGDSTAGVAVIVGILVGIVTFTTVTFTDPTKPMFVFGHFWAPAIIGGVIFGIGMTLAGGCVVGSIWRAGEGQIKLFCSILGIIVGASLTTEYLKADFYDLFDNVTAEHLPESFGSYPLAILFMLFILGIYYWILKWNDRTGKLSAM